MKKQILLIATLIFILFDGYCQIEIAPATTSRPAILHTSGVNAKPMVIGVNGNSAIHIATTTRVGIGTEYTSGTTKLFVNSAKLHIRHNSDGNQGQVTGGAHLLLDEANLDDFARLRFTNSFLLQGSNSANYVASGRYWDIAGKSGSGSVEEDRLHIFSLNVGNILSISGKSNVGINNSDPERSLDVNGSARVSGYTETGNASIAYKTKLIAFTSPPLSCSNGTTFDFNLGVNEDRVITSNVLVATGASSFYPSNDYYNNKEYSYYISGNRIYFEFKAVSGCTAATRSFKVWLTYSENAIPASVIVP